MGERATSSSSSLNTISSEFRGGVVVGIEGGLSFANTASAWADPPFSSEAEVVAERTTSSSSVNTISSKLRGGAVVGIERGSRICVAGSAILIVVRDYKFTAAISSLHPVPTLT